MEKTHKPIIAIIGAGNIGEAVANNLVKNNRPVIVSGRNMTKVKVLTDKLGSLAEPMETGAAIQAADIVILAIWFNAIQPFLYQYESVLHGKTIIDPSNPIAPDGKGGFLKTIDKKESAGLVNASLLPKDVNLIKALGTLSAASLAGASNQQPDRAVLFYATDSSVAKADIEDLITDMGFSPLYAGGIDQSIRLEVFGDLHEFSLGKTLSMAEANAIVKNNRVPSASIK